MSLSLTIVAAVARNGVIGVNNRLPWHLPGELARFRALTMGHPLLMGRKTFMSIGRPLPGRTTIVVSRRAEFSSAGILVARSIDAALEIASQQADLMRVSTAMLVGGAELYQALMASCDRMVITRVDLAPEGDAFFPPIDPLFWRQTSRVAPPPDPRDDASYQIIEYHRIAAPPGLAYKA